MVFGWGNKTETKYKLAEVYTSMRQMMLTTDPTKLGSPIAQSFQVYGVLMETGHKSGIATLVCMADGTTSLYFSQGGGYIGLGEHKGPRQASDELIAAAPHFLSGTEKVKDFPLPNEGYTRFYFLTREGIFSIEAKEKDLGDNKSPLAPFFHKAQEVITQWRLQEERETATISAAARGEVENIRKAFEFDPLLMNCKDKTGLTPLMAAAHMGFEEAIRVLLELGAIIEQKDEIEYTALMFACNAGKTSCVQCLIESGASVHEQANDGSTAIMFAAQHGHNEIIKILLAKGADPKFTGKHGFSAIAFAKQNGKTETEKLLSASLYR